MIEYLSAWLGFHGLFQAKVGLPSGSATGTNLASRFVTWAHMEQTGLRSFVVFVSPNRGDPHTPRVPNTTNTWVWGQVKIRYRYSKGCDLESSMFRLRTYGRSCKSSSESIVVWLVHCIDQLFCGKVGKKTWKSMIMIESWWLCKTTLQVEHTTIVLDCFNLELDHKVWEPTDSMVSKKVRSSFSSSSSH